MADLKVTVEKVRKVMHHPNADRLDLVTVRGWQVIVGRDQYKVGDLCIYVPIDSVLPVDLAHEWDVAKYLRGNMRIKTIKPRQSVSQGLVVSPHQLSNTATQKFGHNLKDGDDLTELLGIKKWVPIGKPGRSMRLQRGQRMNPVGFTPWFPRYTNIDHLNNNPMAFEDDDWVILSEKRHGTNFRMGYVKKAGVPIMDRLASWVHKGLRLFKFQHDPWLASGRYLHVGSHNVIREYHKDDLYWKAALKVQLQAKAKLPKDKVFFFEISGPGVQKGFDYGQEPEEFTVECIDVFCTKSERYLSNMRAGHLCHSLGIPEVPTLCAGVWSLVKSMVDHYASGKATGADHLREGLVLKSMSENKRKVFKFLSPDYLIHQGKKKPEDETEWH